MEISLLILGIVVTWALVAKAHRVEESIDNHWRGAPVDQRGGVSLLSHAFKAACLGAGAWYLNTFVDHLGTGIIGGLHVLMALLAIKYIRNNKLIRSSTRSEGAAATKNPLS